MNWFKNLLGKPAEWAYKAYAKRTERKMAQERADAKLKQTKVEGAQQVTFNDQDVEQLMVRGKDKTWTDEYATVTFLSVINLFVLGGLAHAFGYPQILTGVVTGFTALVENGVDMGFIIEAVALAAVGFSIWRKL